jgi:hypothetical protein
LANSLYNKRFFDGQHLPYFGKEIRIILKKAWFNCWDDSCTVAPDMPENKGGSTTATPTDIVLEYALKIYISIARGQTRVDFIDSLLGKLGGLAGMTAGRERGGGRIGGEVLLQLAR